MSVDVSAVGLDVVSLPPPATFSGAEPDASSESSSVGVPDESDDDDGGEVESNPSGSLPSLASLEESLPIKRGLSSNFWGKSKSFGNLWEVRTVKEMEKRENPVNKRRRTMISYKWSKHKSKSSLRGAPTSMPLLPHLNQHQQFFSHRDEDEDARRRQHLKTSKSCFSLTDLPKWRASRRESREM